MGPEALAHVMRPLVDLFPLADHPDLMLGIEGADDAAVWRMTDDTALVVTTDFFTPIVDDPYDFGAIAAANAMSDVFAMGGQVVLALNLLALPDDLDPEVGAQIVLGGAETVKRAGGVVAGGHSVNDPEPKYGLAVIGRAHPDRILRKSGARVGDLLVLTKAIGTGLITTALKQDVADPENVAAAVASMIMLNQEAGLAAASCGASAATDITGFGLIGHSIEIAERSGVRLIFDLKRLPILDGALEAARAGCAPGGTGRNRDAYSDSVTGLTGLDDEWSDLLYDPQTSGGLLIALASDVAADLVNELGGAAAIVGEVTSGSGIEIR